MHEVVGRVTIRPGHEAETLAMMSAIVQCGRGDHDTRGRGTMHAVIGRVTIKPGHEDETLAMIGQHGVQGRLHWARTLLEGDLVQHSFWLFEEEENAWARRRPCTCPRMLDARASVVSVRGCRARLLEGDLFAHAVLGSSMDRRRGQLRRPSTRSATCPTLPASFVSVDVCEVVGQA